MSLTLGDLRTFCQEEAGKDGSSAKFDRWVRNWINKALARITSAHRWSYYNRTDRITTVVEEAGTTLTVTLGSREVSQTVGGFPQKYLDEKWSLHIDGEDRVSFEFVELSGLTGKFKKGQEWPNATSAVATYTATRGSYELENPAKQILRCEDAFSSYDLKFEQPAAFDKLRQWSPTQRSQATHFTLRHGRLEIWPSPTNSIRVLALSYIRATPRYELADQDDNDTVVDWDPNFRDLLEKAILVEAAVTQGKRAPISYGMAKLEFNERLEQCRADDSNLVEISGVIEDVPGGGRSRSSSGGFERLEIVDWPV